MATVYAPARSVSANGGEDSNEEDTNQNPVAQAVIRLGVTAASHPIEYAKVLIQIGYEPIQPKPTTTLLGKPALALPGVFQYIGFIRRRVGFFGLYHGFPTRVCGSFLSGFIVFKVTESIRLPEEDPERSQTDEEKFMGFIQTTVRDSIARGTAIVVSQPFQVITVRMIAQFVGEEVKYRGFFSSVREIWNHDGISGFFSGVVPRLAGELLALWLASSLSFIINSYLVEDKDLQSYTNAFMAFIASTLTYPFTLVSNVMCVTDSGLVAGNPPHMPIYTDWIHCWHHLSQQHQLKRGSSLLWRYYQGPQRIVDGKPQPVTHSSFQSIKRL